MGGCYGRSYSYSECSSYSYQPDYAKYLDNFKETHRLEDLVKAYKAFMDKRSSGFIEKLAERFDIKNVEDIPKEFDGVEYEIKFDIQPKGKGEEPAIEDYLDAFDFPPTKTSRFLKDPVNNVAEGVNSFIGDENDEKLVVIEKGGGLYLKEKGPVIPVRVCVPYQEIVIKRSEKRYAANIEEVLKKVNSIYSKRNISYKGKIRKEKGDAFVLDTNDGRIYSFTITRAHLTQPEEEKEYKIQRQLELEYAGYIPGFSGFEKDSEKQIVQGMIDLAKYTYTLYDGAPITNGWRMKLRLTYEKKYDFIKGNRNRLERDLTQKLAKVEPKILISTKNAK